MRMDGKQRDFISKLLGLLLFFLRCFFLIAEVCFFSSAVVFFFLFFYDIPYEFFSLIKQGSSLISRAAAS